MLPCWLQLPIYLESNVLLKCIIYLAQVLKAFIPSDGFWSYVVSESEYGEMIIKSYMLFFSISKISEVQEGRVNNANLK